MTARISDDRTVDELARSVSELCHAVIRKRLGQFFDVISEEVGKLSEKPAIVGDGELECLRLEYLQGSEPGSPNWNTAQFLAELQQSRALVTTLNAEIVRHVIDKAKQAEQIESFESLLTELRALAQRMTEADTTNAKVKLRHWIADINSLLLSHRGAATDGSVHHGDRTTAVLVSNMEVDGRMHHYHSKARKE